MTEQTGYLSIPEDLRTVPDFEELGMVLQVEDQYCSKCRRKWADARWEPVCAADDVKGRVVLRGGSKERAKRKKAEPGTRAEVVAEAAAPAPHGAVPRREVAAYMQGSRVKF
ncbi:hypothetical protein ACQP25_44870 (plasmid) [Microtetraspora malaysiensis]|uniref:hypothetical protein n=1 Tax=Microtetraspora malaysiensis TaxID=161358 RepID=UPI003D90F0D2